MMAIDTAKLRAVLRSFITRTSDIEGMALITHDGFPIVALLPGHLDEEWVAAMSVAVLSSGERIGSGLLRGGVKQIAIDTDEGYCLLSECAQETVLVVLAAPEVKKGILNLEVKRAVGELQSLLISPGWGRSGSGSMEIMNLLIAGPEGAGTSAFMRTVNKIESAIAKPIAPDAMDMARDAALVPNVCQLAIAPDQVLHLYEAPLDNALGLLGFTSDWEVLMRQAHAYIVLVAANMPAEFRRARLMYEFMQARLSLPMIVGLTHMTRPDAWRGGDVAIALGFQNASHCPPLISVNVTHPASVANALSVLTKQCMQAD